MCYDRVLEAYYEYLHVNYYIELTKLIPDLVIEQNHENNKQQNQ